MEKLKFQSLIPSYVGVWENVKLLDYDNNLITDGNHCFAKIIKYNLIIIRPDHTIYPWIDYRNF